MANKIRHDDLIYIHEFANIIGLSISTVRNRLHKGYYKDIRIVMTPSGILFHIFDIFKHAHPSSSKDNIERMIFDYRITKSRAKKSASKRKIKRG